MIHELFPIVEWSNRLRVQHAIDRMLERITVVGPFDLVSLELSRIQLASVVDFGEGVPSDVFVLAKGEPPRRECTKIGGLPYRPADIPWPTSRDGNPMTFVAQFCFADSRDLVAQFPGDVLLAFARDERVLWGDLQRRHDLDSMRFEWYRLGITNLVDIDQVPQPGWDFVNCHGVRHRTQDFRITEENELRLESYLTERYSNVFPGLTVQYLTRTIALKIGGLPAWHDRDDIRIPERFPGKLLCSLVSIIPGLGPYPWLNREQEYDLRVFDLYAPSETLKIGGDTTILNVSIDSDGVLHWYR